MTLCVFHANCPDGFTAAWLVHTALGELGTDVRLHGASYNEPPPEIEPFETVYIVDFSYSVPELVKMAQRAHLIHLWDHHKTAIEAVEGWTDRPHNVDLSLTASQSGAQITWTKLARVFNIEEQTRIGQIVAHVGDRDLWTFALEGTSDLFAAMTATPHTIEAWDVLMAQGADTLIAGGKMVDKYRHRLVESALKRVQWTTDIVTGRWVPVVNCDYSIGSDVAAALLRAYPDAPCAGYYLDQSDIRQWGLRSTDDREDVEVLASKFVHKEQPGGGHRNASGFRAHRGAIGMWPEHMKEHPAVAP